MAATNGNFRKLYKLHVYVGVFVAFHFAIFALSGLVLLFEKEIVGVEASSTVTLSSWETAAYYERAVANAAVAHPGTIPLAAYPDDEDPNLLHLRLGQEGSRKLRGAKKVSFDLPTGRELSAPPTVSHGFFDWLLRLHRELFLGSYGKIYVGFVGLAYVFLLVSGIFLYGNFMRGRSFADIRPKLIPALLDFHKSAAAITFGWSLIVGLSGAFLAFNGLLIKFFQLVSLRHLQSAYSGQAPAEKIANLSEVVRSALSAKPGWAVTYVSFPDTEFSIPGHFLLLVNGTEALTKRLSELVVVNAQSGKFVELIELPLYLKIVLLSEPLHFGDYGGIFLKVLWAIFTCVSLAVAMLGLTAFFLKRRQREGEKVIREISPRFSRLGFTRDRPYLLFSLFALSSIAAITGSLYFEGGLGAWIAVLLLLPLLGIFGSRKNA